MLIGRKTFGKGLVQTTRPLGYNSQVKLTVAKYYTPSGRCIQAIDYSHRNPDGSVGKIPDSLMVAFTTANGRTVYDGGGITPDVEVTAEYYAAVTVSLLTEGHIFNYANKYYYEHPTAPDKNDFVVTDEIYRDFLAWADSIPLEYNSELEIALKEFEQAAKNSANYEQLKAEIAAMKDEIAHNQKNDLITYQDEIRDVLAEQIIARYYLRKGEIANSITHDPDVDKAMAILNDSLRYQQLLAIAE